MNYQSEQLVRDLVIAALTLRVFGPALLDLMRRAAAAGVRSGVSEMQRRLPGEENE